MEFEFFLLNYMEELKNKPKKFQVIKHRETVAFLYVAIGILIVSISKSRYVPIILLIYLLILIPVGYLIDSLKENRKILKNIKEDKNKKDIEFLKRFLEKNNLKSKRKIKYLIRNSKTYRNRYSFSEVIQAPKIIWIVFIYFIHPKVQKIIADTLDINFYIFSIGIIFFLTLIYIVFILCILPKLEILKKLEKDLDYIFTYEEDLED